MRRLTGAVTAAAVRTAALVLTGAIALGVGAAGFAPPADAAGDGGASSRLTRDGRIITSILSPSRATAGAGRGVPARSVWVTLTDAELGFLLQVLAARPDLGDSAFRRALDARVGPEAADLDVQVRLVDGVPTGEVRVVPGPLGTAAVARRMVTVLPALPVRTSPPAGTAVPVGEPVFVWFDTAAWAPLERFLTAGGITARVRARPVSVQVRTGDPADVGRLTSCDGPGRPFDPGAGTSPRRQAGLPGRCTVTYRTPTAAGPTGDRLGDVTVLWEAEWSPDDGATWRPLGTVPKLAVVRRAVREVTASLRVPGS
ncbi:MAG: hypothetical protein ACOYOP_05500 [Microthrixaceae bacterium]